MFPQKFDFKKIKDKLFSPAGTKILLIAGFAGILLIFLSNFIPVGSGKPAAAVSSSSSGLDGDSGNLETKLEKILSDISGVGRAEVMVTFQSGAQNVYEQDQKQTTDRTTQSQLNGGTQLTENNDNEQKPVILNGDSGGQQALVKTRLAPQVKGVVVVCDGGNNPDVQEAVVNAISAALDLPSDHICVTKKSEK